MRKELSGIKTGLKSVILLLSVLWLSSCGAPSRSDTAADTSGSGTIGGASRLPATISLSTTKVAVKSDNSETATITASVLDANNAPVEGTLVSFTSTGGQISAATVTTDENGQAPITFSSGTVDKSNQTATITASVLGLSPVQIPIQVTGSTVALSTDNTTITTSGSATLTITVKDAGSIPVYNAPVTLSASGAGAAALSATSGNTDIQGQLVVTVAGSSSGEVIVTVTALGTTATQDYTVGSALTIIVPTPPSDPNDQHTASLSTSGSLTVTVSAPSSTNVTFATTIGIWDGSTSVLTVLVDGGTASATLTSTSTGVANVTVYDPDATTLSDSMTVAISAPSAEADNISLQSNIYVLPPSIGGLNYTATLTATVRTALNQVVGSAPVAFSIDEQTGGGETVSPVIVFTDSSGLAVTTFTSGSLPSGATGVIVQADIVPDPEDLTPPTVSSDTVAIVIGGTAGSVVIGRSTEIGENSTKTAYILPMSILVADSNGNPLSGTSVTLSMWPVQYTTDGTMDAVIGTFSNEDVDENLIMDTGEDLNGDGELTPPNSSAGTVPSTVTTDESGVANFELTYLKASSLWITARLRASAFVQGTETISSLVFTLPASQADIDAGTLPTSPYTAPL